MIECNMVDSIHELDLAPKSQYSILLDILRLEVCVFKRHLGFVSTKWNQRMDPCEPKKRVPSQAPTSFPFSEVSYAPSLFLALSLQSCLLKTLV